MQTLKFQKNAGVHSKYIKSVDLEEREMDIEDLFTNKVGIVFNMILIVYKFVLSLFLILIHDSYYYVRPGPELQIT